MKLGINIDHVATLRQVRGGVVPYPDPLAAASIIEKTSADQLTVHLREDRRHIQDKDLPALRKIVTKSLNMEMAASDEIVDIALKIKPDVATFVPERRLELTTEGGLDVVKNLKLLKRYVNKLKVNSITVSMFIDPDLKQVEASKELGADAIELHTGQYCELCSRKEEINRLKKAAIRAKEIGLYVAAGHGLHYENIGFLVREIPEIVEYNIGHSIIARAIFVGLEEAVAEMRRILA